MSIYTGLARGRAYAQLLMGVLLAILMSTLVLWGSPRPDYIGELENAAPLP